MTLNKKKNKYKLTNKNKLIIMTKQLPTDQIFDVLNRIKQNIGLAVCDFTDNQSIREKAIKQMEVRFLNIQDTIESYFTIKKVLNE